MDHLCSLRWIPSTRVLRQLRRRPRTAAIQRRPPRVPDGLQAHCSPSPCRRLSRPPRSVVTPATTTRAMPPPGAISRRCALPAPREGRGDTGRVPTFTTVRLAGSVPSSSPAGLVVAITRPLATRLPRRNYLHRARPGSPPFLGVPAHRLPGPYPSGLSRGPRLRGFNHWFTRITHCPPCLPRPRDPTVPARRVVVRAACRPSPQLRGQTALSFTGLPRQPGVGVSHPDTNRQRLVAHKRVQADLGVRAALGDRAGDPVGHVAGHQLELLAAVFAEQIQELVDRLAGRGRGAPTPAGRCRGRPRPSGTAGPCGPRSHRPRGARSPANRSRCAWASAATRSQIQPTVRHAIRISSADRRLARVDRQPRRLILERSRERGVVTGPRDRSDHDPVTAAVDPAARRPPESRTSCARSSARHRRRPSPWS